MEEWADCLIVALKNERIFIRKMMLKKPLGFATVFMLSQSDLLTLAQMLWGGRLEGLGFFSVKLAVTEDRAGWGFFVGCVFFPCLLHLETKLSVQ